MQQFIFGKESMTAANLAFARFEGDVCEACC